MLDSTLERGDGEELGARSLRPLGRMGIWSAAFDRRPWREAERAAATIEALGYGTLWVGAVVERNPTTAREVARRHLGAYLLLDNYALNLVRLGFDEADLADGGSNRLVDALVAWGLPGAIGAQVTEHLAAGADHVALQVLTDDLESVPVAAWKELTSHLLGRR